MAMRPHSWTPRPAKGICVLTLAIAATTCSPVSAFLTSPVSLFRGRSTTAPALRGGVVSLCAKAGRPPTSVPDTGGMIPEKEIRSSVSGMITVSEGAQLRYDYLPGNGPTVVFLPALNTTRHGTKSSALKTWCRRNGRSYMVADFYGTGQSEGDYKDATITRWAEDTAKVVDWLAEEHDQDQVVLVGAGVGGWVMLHTAQMRPDSVMGLVGVAADPDFTETLIRPALAERNPEVLAEIESKGIADFEWAGKDYTMTKNLLDDGKRMMVLNKGTKGIPITCPVRLIQGLGDEEIPPESALKIADCLEGEDVVITYVKYGRHALEEDDADFQRIYTCIEDLERAVQRANYMINMIRPV